MTNKNQSAIASREYQEATEEIYQHIGDGKLKAFISKELAQAEARGRHFYCNDENCEFNLFFRIKSMKTYPKQGDSTTGPNPDEEMECDIYNQAIEDVLNVLKKQNK